MTTTRTSRLLYRLAVTSALLVTACGDDDDSADDASASATTEASTDAPADDETTTTAAPDTESAAASEIEVTAVDYGFEDLPATATVGTRLSLTNSSTAEVHELVALRLPDDETRSAEELLALPQEEQEALSSGPPAMVLVTPPGGAPQIEAVGDGTLAEPGRYLVLCAIPTGADPDAYLEAAANAAGPVEVPGGPPHFVNGMFGEITVE